MKSKNEHGKYNQTKRLTFTLIKASDKNPTYKKTLD